MDNQNSFPESKMDNEDASLLEEHLLQHYAGREEETPPEDHNDVEVEKKIPEQPLLEKKKIPSKMSQEIHFLVDEIQDKLDTDMEKVIFSLQHPLAGKNIHILKSFVNTVAHARAGQMRAEREALLHKEEKKQPKKIERHQPELGEIIPPIAPAPSEDQIIPPVPQVAGPLFPEIPDEHHYELSALDAERNAEEEMHAGEHEEIVQIPLVIDDMRNEIVAHAEYNPMEGLYHLYEPQMDHANTALLEQLKRDISDDGILKDIRALEKQVRKSAKKLKMTYDQEDYFALRYYLVRDIAHIGPVSALLNDQKIDAILCEGQGAPLIVIREGKKIKTNVIFAHKDDLNRFLQHVATKTFQHVSVDQPVLDATYGSFRIRGTLGTDIVPSRFLMTRIA